jgi:type I restriction enzyme S subunit
VSWPFVKLGKLCTIVRGSSPRPKGDPLYYGGAVPRLMVSDVTRDGKLVTPQIDFLTEEGAKKSRPMKKGDFIVAVSGQPGQPAILAVDACIHDGFAGLRSLDEIQLDKNYLFHFMISIKEKFGSSAVGAIFKNLNTEQLRELEIPLPPIEEQKRIAAILDKADAIRRKRQQAIQLADDFLRSVFLDMFGDPLTNPKEWEVKSMRNLIRLQGGYAFKSGDFGEAGVPVVKIGNANKLGFTTKGIAFIEPEQPNKLKHYELYAGDLLLSLTGTVGKDDYANITEVTNEFEKYYLNQRVAKITVDVREVSKNYLRYFLADPKVKSEITKNNRGVRQANIGNADIYGLAVPVPTIDMLAKFDCIVNQLRVLNEKSKRMPYYSNSFFNSLSQKAFSGEL